MFPQIWDLLLTKLNLLSIWDVILYMHLSYTCIYNHIHTLQWIVCCLLWLPDHREKVKICVGLIVSRRPDACLRMDGTALCNSDMSLQIFHYVVHMSLCSTTARSLHTVKQTWALSVLCVHSSSPSDCCLPQLTQCHHLTAELDKSKLYMLKRIRLYCILYKIKK